MKRSDIARFWAWFVLLAGAGLGLFLGFGIGAQQSSAGDFATDKVIDLTSTGGDGFNWLLALLGFGPFVVAWAVMLAASWLLESVDPAES